MVKCGTELELSKVRLDIPLVQSISLMAQPELTEQKWRRRARVFSPYQKTVTKVDARMHNRDVRVYITEHLFESPSQIFYSVTKMVLRGTVIMCVVYPKGSAFPQKLFKVLYPRDGYLGFSGTTCTREVRSNQRREAACNEIHRMGYVQEFWFLRTYPKLPLKLVPFSTQFSLVDFSK